MVVHQDSVTEAATTLRLSRLRNCPAIFRNLTDLALAAFDQLLLQLLPAFAAQRRRRLDRNHMSENALQDGDTAVKNRRPSLIAYQVRVSNNDDS